MLSDVAGVVLAGGQATRLGGGDKPLRLIGGRPMLSYVVERLSTQVGPVAISANGDPARFADYGLPVLADEGRQSGPLSGVLSGMAWAKASGCQRVLTVAGDTPFFPHDLANRLDGGIADRKRHVAVAASGGRQHSVFALWPVSLEADLRTFLAQTSRFSVAAFLDDCETVRVPFPVELFDGEEVDPFFNINTPEDLARADAIARSMAP